jgi:hypothetical protein
MNREMIASHLALAEEHVRLGEEHLISQRAIVAELELNGGPELARAQDLLATFESMQRAHIEDRNRLRKELVEA